MMRINLLKRGSVRPLFFLMVLMFGASVLKAQTILISDGGTVNVLGGEMFYDAGGASGNDNNTSYIITLAPSVAGEVVCVDIQSLILYMTSMEYVGQADLLKIYDGPNTSSDQLASLTGDYSIAYNAAGTPYHVGHDAVGGIAAQLNPGMFCANNASGVLTFEFVNQLTGTAPGWEAEVFTFPKLVPGCNISLSTDQLSVCSGTNVTLDVQSAIVAPALLEDFNSGTLNANWSSTPGALSFVNVLTCEPNNGYTTLNTDNSIYAWMQNVAAPRILETMDFDVSNGGYMSFDFRMASDDGAGNGCETPDIGTEEGVFVQYSTNGGVSWTTMKLMFPGEESGASAGIGYQVYDWNKVTLMIPAGAYSANTRFRWIQANSTSASEDSWGIDNVEVAAYGNATLTITDITNNNVIYTGNILNQQLIVSPLSTTTYEAVIDDGNGNTCSQQVTITVSNCGCTDDVGTMTESVSTPRTNNDATNRHYILCDQDRFYIDHNDDFVNDDAANPLVDYYIYTCPPTPGVEPLLDPCAAIASNGVPISYYDNIVLRPDLEEYNDGGNTADILAYLASEGIPVINNTVWFKPVTIDFDGLNNIVDPNCFDDGNAYQITYLNPINVVATEDCASGTVSFQVSGGYPEFFAGNYQITNLGDGILSTSTLTPGTPGDVMTFTISGLTTGDSYEFSFDDNHSCTYNFTPTVFVSCGCSANIGTVNVLIDGVDVTDNINNYYAVCADATIDFESSGFTLPNGTNPIYGWAVLSDAPTTVNPYQDPNYLGDDEGVISSTLNDVSYQGATFWVVPVTLDEAGDAPDQLDADGDGCYAIGTPMQVDFLLPIVASGVEDCSNGTVAITVLGGLPEVDASNYTFSNVQPATASIVGTASHNGSVTLSGLNDGDNYSVEITDANGCVHTFSGGPFVGGPQPTMITVDQSICGANLMVEAIASDVLNTLLWTLPANVNTNDALNGEQLNLQFTSNGVYTITFNEDNGTCNSSVQVNITVDSLGVTALANNANCGASDGSIQLTQTTGSAIQSISCIDASGNNSGTTDLTSLQINDLAGGSYTINLDNGNCIQSLNVVVANNGAPTLTIDATADLLCFEDGSGTMSASVTGNTGGLIYTLIGGNDNVNLVQNDNGAFNGLAAGNYTLTVEDDVTNCTASDFFTLFEPNELLLSVSNDTMVCDGAVINLSAYASGGSGNHTYSFDGVNNGALNTYSYTVNGAQSVTVEVNDGQCPVVTEAINITVFDALDFTLSYTPNPAVICPGETVSLSANVNTGSGSYTYNWMENGISVSSNPTLNTVLNTSTTIAVEVTDACGTNIETIDVTVEDIQAPTLSLLVYEQCETGDAVISIDNPNANYNYQWTFSDGSTANGVTMYNLVTDEEGCVDLILEISSNSATCQLEELYEDFFCVYPNPVARFSYQAPVTVSNTNVQFINASSGATSYQWNFGDGDVSHSTNPNHEFPAVEGESYEVVLLAVNDSTGCSSQTIQNVVILEDFAFYMPNAFTPNDDEENAIFIPVVSGIDRGKKYDFRIFDRWGNVIFYTTNPEEGWDGLLQNGKVAKDGVYAWKVELFNAVEGKGEVFNGHVNVIK